jgi:hypothetical protein
MIRNLFSKQSFRTLFLAMACFSLAGISAYAQTDTMQDGNAPNPASVGASNPETQPVVSQVTGIRSSDENPNQAGLGEEILVSVSNAEQLVMEAKQKDAKIVLYINDTPVKDVVSEHTAEGFRFFFENDGDVNDLWNHLMASRAKGEFFVKHVSVTVGIDGEDPIPTKIDGKKNNYFQLTIVRKGWFIACIFLMLIIFVAFILLARKTDMLRDTGIAPAVGRKPYSLSRVQMGIWFLTILSSWLFLYVCLHRYNLLTESILILMGITSATGVGGIAMDSNKTQMVVLQSEGFWKDLITDHANVSLFRFQNFAWTVVLVCVFIRSVFNYLKMPEFDSTLLTLMGISSGTYIGAKVTEKNNPDSEPQVATVPVNEGRENK